MPERDSSDTVRSAGSEETTPPLRDEATSARSTGFFLSRLTTDEHPAAIGPYRILKVLGEGGMGVVYHAEQSAPVRRQVALKLIKAGMDTREVVARFESERQALALMNHSSIAKVLDAGSTPEGRPYFVMEYVEGSPITDYCEKRGLKTRQRLDLFIKVCEAVQHAHHKAIIHRDLKPSNVLVGEVDGEPLPKVIDFGIAKAVDQRLTEKTFFTETGQIMGTPAYMSPEQTGLAHLDIDARTDIYSLGVILYELLAGALPFDSHRLRSAGFVELIRIIREEEPRRPSTLLGRRPAPAPGAGAGDAASAGAEQRARRQALAREIRGDLDWITVKALEKDPARRYASASELAEDLRRHLRDEPVLAGPPSTLYRLGKFVRRNRIQVAAAAVVVALAVGFLAAGWTYSLARYRQNLRAADSAVERKDLDAAESMLAVLQESRPGLPAVVALASRVDGLRRELAIREALALAQEAEGHARSFRAEKAGKEDLERAWRESAGRHELWDPPWERRDELDAWHRLEALQQRLDSEYNEASRGYSRAMERAPADSKERTEIQRALGSLLMERVREAEADGRVQVSRDFFRSQIEALGLETYREELEGRGRVALTSDPPGAEVWCFRYQNREERLVPLPFDPRSGLADPARGLRGGPFLRVEKVWDSTRSPFRPGDRLVSVRGQAVGLLGELARALETVTAGQSVEALVRRSGKEEKLSWIPVPQDARTYLPGRLIDPLDQLGLTFEGYPLEFEESARLGATAAGAALETTLPRGSYLLVFRKPGFSDTRVPLLIPADAGARAVRLLAEAEVPPGFAHVPAGPFLAGGDPQAYESLHRTPQQPVDGFLLARQEVTFREYLEFINDPETSERLDAEGGLEPGRLLADWTEEDLKSLRPPERISEGDRKPSLVPLFRDGPGFRRGPDGRWESRLKNQEVPVLGISLVAALEYARWFGRKHQNRWRFRIPRDLEWEKAARGVDGRLHVWGDYLFLGFCHSLDGVHPRSPRRGVPALGGSYPFDESVYGIRDLAGSMGEPTASKAVRNSPSRFYVYRGGGFNATDLRDFHVATRNRRITESRDRFLGIRLAADLPPRR